MPVLCNLSSYFFLCFLMFLFFSMNLYENKYIYIFLNDLYNSGNG